jgi:hypothetical protein
VVTCVPLEPVRATLKICAMPESPYFVLDAP